MSKALAAIFVAVVAISTAGAAPTISGDQTVKPGGFALLRLTGADAAIWDVSPEPIQAEEVAGSFVFTASPGTYTVRAIIVNFEAKKIERVKYTVIFLGGPGPQPVPPVPPGPDPPKPDPPRPVGKLFAVVVEETRQAVGGRAAWFADKELTAYMQGKGHRFRIVDKDVQDSDGHTPADVKRFVDDAKAKELPQLYLVGEDGKTVRSGPMPKTPAELVALLKQYGG